MAEALAPELGTELPVDGLFVVWFDANRFFYPEVTDPDWWWEKPGAQPLSAALDMATKMRADGWTCKVMPDGMNPRPDGRWDNPAGG